MKTDKQIISDFYGKGSRKNLSEKGLAAQKREDKRNRAFYAGDKAEINYDLSSENKKYSICFNRVKPFVHAFGGFAAQNRRKPEFFAVVPDDFKRQLATETANQFLDVIRSSANADQVETQQDLQLAICGYGAVAAIEDYTENCDGKIIYEEVTEDYYWDPSAKKAGLLDRRWEFIKKVMSADEAVDMFGGNADDYELVNDPDKSQFEYYPNGGLYNKISLDWVKDTDESKVNVYEYHWYDLETFYEVDNPAFDEFNQQIGLATLFLNAMDIAIKRRLEEEEESDLHEFNPRAKELLMNDLIYKDFKAICKELNIEYEAEEYKKKVYYEAVLSGSKLFKKRKATDQSGFSVKVKTADYYKDKRIWQGMVSSLREPAKYANKSITEFMLILAATSKAGVIYDITKVEDVAGFESNIALNARAIGVKGNPNEIVSNKQQPVLPNGYDTLYPLFVQALSEVTGFAPEAMGMGDLSQPSFELEQQRIKQVMTTLVIYFDSISLYQKERARGDLYLMRRLAKNREGRAIAVYKEGERAVSEIYSDMIAEDYVIDIAEAPDTPTRKKEQMAFMATLADKIAMIAPDKALSAYQLATEYFPISTRDKTKWRELLTPPPPSPEQMQKAQQADEIQTQSAVANMNRIMADAELKAAQARKATAEINKVEAEADKANLEVVAMSTVPVNELNVNI